MVRCGSQLRFRRPRELLVELITMPIMTETCALDEDRDDPEVGVIALGELTTLLQKDLAC